MNPSFRIISLIASSTEIVCALGMSDCLVGISHECDYPTSVLGLPRVTSTKFICDGMSYQIDERVRALLQEGLSVYRVDGDKLRSLRPDVILTQTQCEVCAVSERDVLEATGLWLGRDLNPKIVSLHTDSMADLWLDIQRVANALAIPESGAELVRTLQARLTATAARTFGKAPPVRVACIEWIEPLMTSGNWMPELLANIGATNLFGEPGKHSPMLSWEQLKASDPDVILIFPCGFSIERTLFELPRLLQNPVFTELRAVQNKKVYIGDGNQYFNRPGPRLVETQQIISEILWPEFWPEGVSFKATGPHQGWIPAPL